MVSLCASCQAKLTYKSIIHRPNGQKYKDVPEGLFCKINNRTMLWEVSECGKYSTKTLEAYIK